MKGGGRLVLVIILYSHDADRQLRRAADHRRRFAISGALRWQAPEANSTRRRKDVRAISAPGQFKKLRGYDRSLVTIAQPSPSSSHARRKDRILRGARGQGGVGCRRSWSRGQDPEHEQTW